MSRYILTLFLLQLFALKGICCCSCGCGRPDYVDQGMKLYADGDIQESFAFAPPPPPPPPSIYKELEIAPVPYQLPMNRGCGETWPPILPKCYRKRIRFPSCIPGVNLLRRKLAIPKLGVGYNLAPLRPPCLQPLGYRCGCGFH